MRVMAQVGMVMNLDKCIGCHTCSVTCKQAWTNRAGTEYVWFNNVETRPGQGYPRRYEDQEKWKGGWDLNKRGRLKLKAGGRLKKLVTIFASPVQPEINDYYEPWTYDYQTLIDAPLGDDFPVARPKSLLTGKDTKITWSANWDDNLGGVHEMGHLDPLVEKVRRESEDKIKFQFEQTFMFYLPRICEHCLNPSCMASCPSGAIYKREEDGIVLIDQSRCRGYQRCVEACPYKKAIFRPNTNTSEKCVACYPRIEGKDQELSPNGEPCETRCMTSCPGKIRLQGLVEIGDDGNWVADPSNPLYYLIRERKVALPLYPQFGTEPNGFYIPPRWVPRGYLNQMFGPGVQAAIEQYSCPDRELLSVLQLFRATRQILFRFEIVQGPKVAEIEVTMPDGTKKTQSIWNDTVLGFNRFGKEVVRITTEEPVFERPKNHANSI